MTVLRRITGVKLGRPVAGQLVRTAEGPVVPIRFGRGDELLLDNPGDARDLAIAASVAASVLESEHGLPATTPPTSNDAALLPALAETLGNLLFHDPAFDPHHIARALLERYTITPKEHRA